MKIGESVMFPRFYSATFGINCLGGQNHGMYRPHTFEPKNHIAPSGATKIWNGVKLLNGGQVSSAHRFPSKRNISLWLPLTSISHSRRFLSLSLNPPNKRLFIPPFRSRTVVTEECTCPTNESFLEILLGPLGIAKVMEDNQLKWTI